jgi:hypothetical protein
MQTLFDNWLNDGYNLYWFYYCIANMFLLVKVLLGASIGFVFTYFCVDLIGAIIQEIKNEKKPRHLCAICGKLFICEFPDDCENECKCLGIFMCESCECMESEEYE